jgi:hypothetical protein
MANDDVVRGELRDWLGGELKGAEAVVVKDPRVGWFLPLWLGAARDLGAPVSFVCMLRHPAEILLSARKNYGDWQVDGSRASAWLNVMLETEHKTREIPRAFVRYDDLLADWEKTLARAGGELNEPLMTNATRSAFPAVDEFVDPTLRRNVAGWDDLDVAPRVRDMAERVWTELLPLNEAGGDTPAVRGALDSSRAEYAAMYAEAEAIAQSSVTAVKPRKGAATQTRPGLYVRIARRIPEQQRRRIRRLLGRKR